MHREPHIGHAADELTRQLLRAEAYLVSLDLGVAASVALECGSKLEFRKIDGVWRLVFTPSDSVRWQSIKGASMRQRVEAAAAMPELLDALMNGRANRIEDVREVSAALASWLDERETHAQSR